MRKGRDTANISRFHSSSFEFEGDSLPFGTALAEAGAVAGVEEGIREASSFCISFLLDLDKSDPTTYPTTTTTIKHTTRIQASISKDLKIVRWGRELQEIARRRTGGRENFEESRTTYEYHRRTRK